MELVPEGRNFRLVREEELPQILNFLETYLPESLKVKATFFEPHSSIPNCI